MNKSKNSGPKYKGENIKEQIMTFFIANGKKLTLDILPNKATSLFLERCQGKDAYETNKLTFLDRITKLVFWTFCYS